MNAETPIQLTPPPETKSHLPAPLNATGHLPEVDLEEVKYILGKNFKLNDALPGLQMHEPTALLLDINNLYKRSSANNFSIDYGLLKQVFEQRCDLRYSCAFTAIDREDSKARRWLSYMEQQGFEIVTRDLKRYVNNKGQLITKGNMDIELTIAAMDLSEAFGHIIIGTCDGDFSPLIERLRYGNFRKVSVLGMTNHEWRGMSTSLIQVADYFYDLTQIQEWIEYKETKRA